MTTTVRLAFVCCLACASLACKEPIVIEGREATVSIDIRAASSPDALAGADPVGSFAVTLFREDPPGEPVSFFLGTDGTSVDEAGLPEPLPDLGAAERARVFVWGMTLFGDAYSLGRSAPFALPAEGTAHVPVFLGVIDELSEVGSARLARAGSASVLLDDNRVLVAGGADDQALVPAALYDHATGSDVEVSGGLFALYPSACALPGGEALLVGGEDEDGTFSDGVWWFDGESLARAADLPTGVSRAQLACVPDEGRAFLVGGRDGDGPRREVLELVANGPDITVTSLGDLLSDAREQFSLSRLALASKSVFLLAGGRGAAGPLASAEVLEVDGDVVVIKALDDGGHPDAVTDLGSARFAHAATTLSSTTVLLYGGADDDGPLADPAPLVFSAEISDPGAFLPLDIGDGSALATARAGASLAALPDGSALLVGGAPGAAPALRFTLAPGQSPDAIDRYQGSLVALGSADTRMGGEALTLPDDSVLFVGGRADGTLEGGLATAVAGAEVLISCALDDSCEP